MTKYLLFRKTSLFIFLSFIIFLFTNILSAQVYFDSTANIEDRIEDLLSRMTLDEKIGQMAQTERSAVTGNSDITTYFLGSILSGGGSVPQSNNAESWTNMYDSFQAQALNTRLKIPIIYGIDAVHGHNNVRNAVIFPHNIGLGCARDSELVRQAAIITAKEIMGTGLNWTFAPCIAVPQNERWGRTYEGFSESPELVSQLGAASVLGFQGDSLMGKSSIVACAKHYVGDGGTTGGYDQGNTEVDEETLRRIHLPGYIAAINAGVGTVMASFSSWNGSKLHGNKYLLTDVLKNELEFTGFVVSDWAAIDQLPGTYLNKVEASINAGIDMVMLPYNYETFISTAKTLVSQGLILQSRIDDAVRRILRIKLKAGLFEHPYADRTYSDQIGSDAHRLVARECVRKSLVLLKMKDNVL
ncbi:MAG TPA: glycoside hydrolase family 3 protein, partial [Ignavibacteriaceae bacterium]|nr:glycoside hydrolase family 3 protein [Ignavibacteriaceae bacterium]